MVKRFFTMYFDIKTTNDYKLWTNVPMRSTKTSSIDVWAPVKKQYSKIRVRMLREQPWDKEK